MVDYVQVPVPTPLVATVMRLVTDYLSDTDDRFEASEVWTELAGDRRWSTEWWFGLRPDERQLLRILNDATDHALETTALARELRLTPGDLAGILGPLNRRVRQEGLPPPVESRQQRAPDGGGRRIKVVWLVDGVASIVERLGAREAPTQRPVRKRRPTPGAPSLKARPTG